MSFLKFNCETPYIKRLKFDDLKTGECYVPDEGPGVFMKVEPEVAFSFTSGTCRVALGMCVRRIDATLHWRISESQEAPK